jgi:hypothetical protein
MLSVIEKETKRCSCGKIHRNKKQKTACWKQRNDLNSQSISVQTSSISCIETKEEIVWRVTRNQTYEIHEVNIHNWKR